MAQHVIRFILDDRVTEIGFSATTGLQPTTTVLKYLRLLAGHHGVKEGCGEGDCGACTVVVAEAGPDEKLSYRSVDSCLVFLPFIHGKQLITVENLATQVNSDPVLHPVQKAVVDHYGTQCGYCTPGIVMSIFALYKNHRDPSRENIEEALAGNLCRCTGYRSVLDAAARACAGEGHDHFDDRESATVRILNQISSNKETIIIRTGDQCYFRPFTLGEALRLRKEHPESIVINGSTDVALRQTKKKEFLASVLDLSGVDELRYFRKYPGGYLIGAGLTLEMLKKEMEGRIPAMHRMLRVFGSLQIRNVATVGGNVGSASPIGDTLPVLFACRAEIELTSLAGTRVMSIDDFITGYRLTALREDEIITAVRIPEPEEGTRIESYKVSKRRDVDISSVSAGFRVLIREGKVAEAVLAFGGMAAVTKRAFNTEQSLSGENWNRETIEKAMKVLATEFEPISDARAEAGYRISVARNLLLKFYSEKSG